MESKLNEKYVTGYGKISNNRSITAEFNILQDLDKVFVQSQFSLGKPYVMLFNKTINVCQFFLSKYRDPFIYIIYNEISKIIPVEKCPLKKVIYKRNFTVD